MNIKNIINRILGIQIKEQKNPIETLTQAQNSKFKIIPKGWYVSEAGQDPLHMLWYVVLVNFDDLVNKVENPRLIAVEEYDSFELALEECIKKIN